MAAGSLGGGSGGVPTGARIVVCAVVWCVTLALWLTIATGAAASGWIVQQTPNPAGVYSDLPGVSCASPRSCTAVGFSTSHAGTSMTLAERWNGTSWSIQRTPNPAGATSSSLLAVSCASARSCTAVGFFTDRANTEETLAERWNGTSWSIQRTPHLAGATSSQLVAVSCASTRSCTAVGFWYLISQSSSEVMLAERWNGTTWSIQRTPNPAGSTYGQFGGVSCPSLRSCTAVGFLTDRADIEVTLAQRWHAASWSIQRTPNPAGARSSGLDEVSCASTRSCTAVGFLTNHAGIVATLAERWNGTSWSVQGTPNLIGGVLFDVSCASMTACTAIGSSGRAMLAERWNGVRWAIQQTPNPAGATSSELDGVSCASTRSCTAVGFFTNLAGITMTLAARYS